MTPFPQDTPPDARSVPAPDALTPAPGRLAKLKKDKKKKASKGIETLFRTTLSSHLKLSEMADRKANLMISINTIVVSIVISAYARKYEVPGNLLIPSILLLFVCLITIVVSLIATNTTISPIPKPMGEPAEHPVDLLFFGSYTRLTADEYRHNVRQLIGNDEDLYNSLIDNVYAQGKVLTRKYRLLRFAYQFFMIGFSVVIVLTAVLLFFAR